MAVNWKHRRPYAKVIFHTKKRRAFILGGNGADDITATKNIIQITTQNDINKAAGNFSISLVYKRDSEGQPLYYKLIKPLDLVDIHLSKSGSTMVGIVDSVGKSTIMTSQGPRRSVNITGRSLGAIWQFDLVKYFKYTVGIPDELIQRNTDLQLGKIQIGFFKKSPVYAITTLSQKMPALEIKLKEKTLKDFLDVGTELFSRKDEKIYNIKPSPYSGSIFNYFMKYASPPFNQLWTESKDGKMYLRMRPTPYSLDTEEIEDLQGNAWNQGWRTLTNWIDHKHYHEIHPSAVIQEKLEVAHNGAFSIFAVLSGTNLMGGESEFSAFPPLVEPDLYRELGSRDLQIRLSYLPMTDNGETTEGTLERHKFYRKKLYLWNKDNHRFENGNMIIRGDSDIRVGDKIYRSDTQNSYYCTGVGNNWQFGAPMKTTLQLSRGATEKQRKIWYDQGMQYLRSVGL